MALPSSYQYFLRAFLLIGVLIEGTLGDEKLVFESIIEAQHYNTKVRPRHNSSHPVKVELEFELRQIASLDQQNQVLFTSGFIVAMWEDEYLTWKPEEFNDTNDIVIPPKYVWLPDFGVINSADTFYHDSFTKDFRVHVDKNGNVLWSFGGTFATTCELDLTYFPFDRQVCSIIIENWAYDAYQVELHNHSHEVHLDDFHRNGEWDIEHTKTSLEYIYHEIFPGKPYPKVKFTFYLLRKAGYYGLNIISPCFFIICMSLVMFWLPADSGEKVSLGITVLLAFSVFQLVIAESSPKTSDFVPILSLYVAFVMGMSAVSTVTAIISLYFHHHLPNRPVPRLIKIIFFKFLAKLMCMTDDVPDMASTAWVAPEADRTDQTIVNRPPTAKLRASLKSLQIEDMEDGNDLKKGMSNSNENFLVDLNGLNATEQSIGEVLRHLRFITSRMKERDLEDSVTEEWKALARVIDRVFFYICLVVITTVCLWMFTQSDSPKHL